MLKNLIKLTDTETTDHKRFADERIATQR